MGGWTPISPWKLAIGTAQVVTSGAASAASTPVGSETRALLIYASASVHIRISQGTNAADPAVATDTFIPGGASPMVLGCSPGDRVKVIQDTAGGTVYITELTY